MKELLRKLINKIKYNYISPNINKDNVLLIINENADLMIERFGITEERAEDITKYIEELIDKQTKEDNFLNTVNLLVETSKICLHQNELAYSSFMIGQFIHKYQNPAIRILNIKDL